MTITPLDLVKKGVLASSMPSGGGTPFSYVGADTNNDTFLNFPAVIPNTQSFMIFISVRANIDERGLLFGLEPSNSSRGIRIDDNASDGSINPDFEIPKDGASDILQQSSAAYAIGDIVNLLVTGEITNSNNTHEEKIVMWDETSATAVTEFNQVLNTSITSYDWDRFGPDLPALFAGSTGQRQADVMAYRFAYWDDADFSGGVPDITQSSVQDNFFNGTTGALVDPATSHSAYGTPIYDIYGSLADWNAGTNKGSGSDFTKDGPDFTLEV